MPSPGMGSCCVTAQCLAMRALAASYMAACSPTSPVHPSPTSATTTLRRSFMGCCLPLVIIGIMATNLANARLVTRFGSDWLLRAGTVGAALAEVPLAVTTRTDCGGLMGLVVPLFVFVAMAGFIVANSIVGALGGFPHRAGAVSALVGAIQYGSGIIGSALVGAFGDGTPWPMGWVIALTGIGSTACAWFLLGGTAGADTATR